MPAVAPHRRVFVPVLLALVVLAWAALAAIDASPYARYLEHGDFVAAGPIAEWCRSLPGGTLLLPAAFQATAWVLMIAAMMLPSALPLVTAFDRLASARADRSRLLVLLVAGYVVVWAAFGLVAHGLHAALLAAAQQLPGLAAKAWAVGAATLALAGAFQFSRFKHLCLDKCRTPLGFIIEHWRGRRQAWQAFALGAHHGLFCVGCCWALMLLMFVVGAGNLGWMLLLAALMAVEKNLAWGRRISAPLGWALLVAAAALVLLRA